MSAETEKNNSLPVSPISLVKAIQNGQVNAKGLSIQDRQMCVEYLANQGGSTAEIAEVLKVSDRTVRRDMGQIREKNAVEPDEGFTARFAGQILQDRQFAVDGLKRLSRDRSCPHHVVMQAYLGICNINKGTAEMLQSFGYLPGYGMLNTDGNFHLPDPEDLIAEFASLKGSIENGGIADATTAQEIADIEKAITILSTSNKIKQVQSKIVEHQENEHEKNKKSDTP